MSAADGGTPNFQNRTLYHGDNLDFLRGMNSETVHLIATDPPFNKNRDFHATPDSLARGARFKDRWRWDDDVHEEWTDSIIDDWPAVWEVITAARAAYGDDMGAFLCWLGVRLMEMRRVLRKDGSIYLHIDHTAHAYVKCLMDAIFGSKNFRDAIVWHRAAENLSRKKLRRATETILYYSKAPKIIWNLPWEPLDPDQIERDYRYEDEFGRFTTTSCTNNADRPNMVYEFNGNTRQWRYSRETMLRLSREGKLVYNAKGIPRRKRYLSEVAGKPMTNVWSDIKVLASNAQERTGYPTQKPLALYRRIIETSSNEGDIVLDPFCGCATTPVAAEQLKRQWVGMDIWDGAKDIVLERLEKEWLFTREASASQMFPHIVHVEDTPPARTDEKEVAAKSLKLKIERPVAPWQKLTRNQMTRLLAQAQESSGGVACAGCGRVLEVEFMQLDHIQPRSEGGANHITNRILLCGPCNRRKRDNYTLRGLVRENKKKHVAWMKDADLAKMAWDDARKQAEWVRDNFHSPKCQQMLDGA